MARRPKDEEEDLDMRQLLTKQEAAEVVRVHPRTIERWIHVGRIRASRLSPRVVRIRRSELERLLRESETSKS